MLIDDNANKAEFSDNGDRDAVFVNEFRKRMVASNKMACAVYVKIEQDNLLGEHTKIE